MLVPSLPVDLVEYVARTTDLRPVEAARVVADVLAYYGETPEDWVRRRHRELQRQGLTNDAIFTRVAGELGERRFRSGELTVRQLRRIVYG